MLGTIEVCAFYYACVEEAEVLVRDEVGRLGKTHIAGSVGIIHQHVSVSPDPLEEIRGFAGSRLGVHALLVQWIGLVDLVGNGMLDAGCAAFL